MTQGIARDMSRKVQTKLAETFDRELNIARHALSPAELGEVMIEAAVMMAQTSAASIAGFAEDRQGAAGLFGASIRAIVASIDQGTPDALQRALTELERRS